jgi:predicted nucleotidyltransferase component of viral defense system
MQLKAKIKNIAIKSHISAQAVLQNFMLERLLERITKSSYHDNLILKGGMLIASMVGIHNRTTMDMDATILGYPLSDKSLHIILSDICAIPLDDDTVFTIEYITPIRGDDEYGGYRVAMLAKYESINTPLKLDITVGDVITPSPIAYKFPSAFEKKQFSIWAYNIETILAEKVETIFRRSILNTRLRDFYDVYIMIKKQKINKKLFTRALQATSQNRGSMGVWKDKENIMSLIQEDKTMLQRWKLYSDENKYASNIAFTEIFNEMKNFLIKQFAPYFIVT